VAKKQAQREEHETPEKQPGDLFALTRRVLLAGVGAVALAYDEARAFVERLVERGELARGQARDLLKEVSEKQEGRMQGVRERARDHLGRALEAADVPRRSDLESLQRRLDQLTERVEALLQQKEAEE
jgi:poly(hydroxyalkanoate) granule-associated protein